MPASATGYNVPQLLNWGPPYQTTIGAALASSTTLTDISPPQNASPVDNYSNQTPWYPGNIFLFEAFFIYGTSGAPTLTLGFYYGGTGGTAMCATAAVTTASGVTANTSGYARALVRVTGHAASGNTIVAQGFATNIAATAGVTSFMPATASVGNAVAINTTTTGNALSFGATWGTSNASSTITCTQYYIWQLC